MERRQAAVAVFEAPVIPLHCTPSKASAPCSQDPTYDEPSYTYDTHTRTPQLDTTSLGCAGLGEVANSQEQLACLMQWLVHPSFPFHHQVGGSHTHPCWTFPSLKWAAFSFVPYIVTWHTSLLHCLCFGLWLHKHPIAHHKTGWRVCRCSDARRSSGALQILPATLTKPCGDFLATI